MKKPITKNNLKQDINKLKEICQLLKDNYDNSEWNLSEQEENELYRITGFEQHDWDDCNLAHFIDGMQRALELQRGYDSSYLQFAKRMVRKNEM